VIHNALARDIEAARSKLETCSSAELCQIQAEILVRRQLVGWLATTHKR